MEHWFTVQNWEKRPFLPQVVIIFLQPPSPGLVFKFQKTGFLAASRNHVKSHIEVGANTSLTIDQIEIDLDVQGPWRINGNISLSHIISPYIPLIMGDQWGKKRGYTPNLYGLIWYQWSRIPWSSFRGWTSSKNVFVFFYTMVCGYGDNKPTWKLLELFWEFCCFSVDCLLDVQFCHFFMLFAAIWSWKLPFQQYCPKKKSSNLSFSVVFATFWCSNFSCNMVVCNWGSSLWF